MFFPVKYILTGFFIFINLQDSYVYCLALVKSGDVNIIGREYLVIRNICIAYFHEKLSPSSSSLCYSECIVVLLLLFRSQFSPFALPQIFSLLC